MELGLLLFGFAAYLYFPHLLFKLVAERYVDLGAKLDTNQFEDVVGASFPSLLFHFQSWLLIRGLAWLWPAVFAFPKPDWRAVAAVLFKPDGADRLAAILDDGLLDPTRYFVVLTLIVIINGLSYGKGALLGIYATAFPEMSESEPVVTITPTGWWSWVKFGAAVGAFWMWKTFYRGYHVALYPFAVLKPHMYIRTTDSLIYHGRFVDYLVRAGGTVDTIVLEDVRRFSRRGFNSVVAAGENPIHRLEGTFHLKWDRVADINTVAPGEIEALWERLESEAAPHRPISTGAPKHKERPIPVTPRLARYGKFFRR